MLELEAILECGRCTNTLEYSCQPAHGNIINVDLCKCLVTDLEDEIEDLKHKIEELKGQLRTIVRIADQSR